MDIILFSPPIDNQDSALTPPLVLINSLILNSSIDSSYIKIILKVIGISYLVEFGKDICKDAGESAIANKIEVAGKIVVVAISVPVVASLIEIVTKLV